MVARFIPKFFRDLFDVPAPEVGRFLRWGTNGQIENADAPGGALTPPVDVDAAGAEGNGGRVVFPYFQNPIPFVDAGGIPTGGLLVKMRDEGGNTCANIMAMSRVWTDGDGVRHFGSGNQYAEEGGAHLELQKWHTDINGAWVGQGSVEVAAEEAEGRIVLQAAGDESGLNQNRLYLTKQGQDVLRIDNGGVGAGPYVSLRSPTDGEDRIRADMDNEGRPTISLRHNDGVATYRRDLSVDSEGLRIVCTGDSGGGAHLYRWPVTDTTPQGAPMNPDDETFVVRFHQHDQTGADADAGDLYSRAMIPEGGPAHFGIGIRAGFNGSGMAVEAQEDGIAILLDGSAAGTGTNVSARFTANGLEMRSPDGTWYRLSPPNGGGPATWTAV